MAQTARASGMYCTGRGVGGHVAGYGKLGPRRDPGMASSGGGFRGEGRHVVEGGWVEQWRQQWLS